jgi:hypothetical protein
VAQVSQVTLNAAGVAAHKVGSAAHAAGSAAKAAANRVQGTRAALHNVRTHARIR